MQQQKFIDISQRQKHSPTSAFIRLLIMRYKRHGGKAMAISWNSVSRVLRQQVVQKNSVSLV